MKELVLYAVVLYVLLFGARLGEKLDAVIIYVLLFGARLGEELERVRNFIRGEKK